MRRTVLVFAVVALLIAMVGAPASAKPPLHVSWSTTLAVEDGDLTAACGFEVTLVFEGNVNATLFYDANGAIVREIDTFPAYTWAYTANGLSIGSPMSSVGRFEYTEGAAPGSSVVYTLSGLQYRIGPHVTYSGRMVFAGVVSDSDIGPYDLPWIELTDVISQGGNFFEGDWSEWAPAVCEALTP